MPSSLSRPQLLGKCGSRASAQVAMQVPPALWWKTASRFSLPQGLERLMCSSGGHKDLLDVAHEVSGLTITDPRGFWNLAKERPRK